MTPKQEAALRQVREALVVLNKVVLGTRRAEEAITAIDEALADSALDRMAENARELGLDYEPPCKTGSQCTNKCQQCEQPAQQEPVAVVSGYYGGQCVVVPTNPARIFNSGTAFYTSQPPRKPWVGLTQQDINIAFDDTQEGGGFDDFARAIETKLREKNAPQQSKEDA